MAVVVITMQTLPGCAEPCWDDVRRAVQRCTPINGDLVVSSSDWSGDVDTIAAGMRVMVEVR